MSIYTCTNSISSFYFLLPPGLLGYVQGCKWKNSGEAKLTELKLGGSGGQEKRKQNWEEIPHRIILRRERVKEDILQEDLLCDVLCNLKGVPGKSRLP